MLLGAKEGAQRTAECTVVMILQPARDRSMNDLMLAQLGLGAFGAPLRKIGVALGIDRSGAIPILRRRWA
jgi:hypothetical protein